MSKKNKPAAPEYPKVIETFRELSPYLQRELERENPSCFNGDVSVKKYRITIEEISEPISVIAERLQKLWDESNNIHHRDPLRAAAAQIGYSLSERKFEPVK